MFKQSILSILLMSVMSAAFATDESQEALPSVATNPYEAMFSTANLPEHGHYNVTCKITSIYNASVRSIFVYPLQGQFGDIKIGEMSRGGASTRENYRYGSKLYIERSSSFKTFTIEGVTRANEAIVFDLKNVRAANASCYY